MRITAPALQRIDVLPGEFYDSHYPIVAPASSVVADTFGTFVEIFADVGTLRRLYYMNLYNQADLPSNGNSEIEVAVGAAASEVVIARASVAKFEVTGVGQLHGTLVPCMIDLADNVRLSVRVRDTQAGINAFRMYALVGPQ